VDQQSTGEKAGGEYSEGRRPPKRLNDQCILETGRTLSCVNE